MQRDGPLFIERRVESLELVDDHFYSALVTQQFTVPRTESDTTGAETDLLIPIGQFSKIPLPDLKVKGADGQLLPILNPEAAAGVLSLLFMASWQEEFLTGVGSADRADALLLWDHVRGEMTRLITSPPEQAYTVITDIRRFFREVRRLGRASRPVLDALQRQLRNEQFWAELHGFAESTVLLAELRGVPGRTYVTEVTYTERFAYHAVGTIDWMRRLIVWLGWSAASIYRQVANAGQAEWVWVIQTVPEGVEPVRLFWDDRRLEAVDPERAWVESDRAIAAHSSGDKTTDESTRGLVLDVQIDSSASIVSATALALFLLVVSTYIYQRVPQIAGSADERSALVALGGLFSAAPAAIAGALAYRGRTFVRRVSRGPRKLLALLSAQAAFLGIVVSLKTFGDLVEWSAFSLSLYCFLLIGALGYISVGPRWRKSDRSRLNWRTKKASPADCQQHQRRTAMWFGIVWLLMFFVFARCQYMLQDDHFFTSEFPGNILQAWTSLFD
jgi:hypothetical protein